MPAGTAEDSVRDASSTRKSRRSPFDLLKEVLRAKNEETAIRARSGVSQKELSAMPNVKEANAETIGIKTNRPKCMSFTIPYALPTYLRELRASPGQGARDKSDEARYRTLP